MRKISFLIITIYISINIFSQDNITQGKPFIQNYSNKDYNAPDDQTWAILQDKNGVMYFGKNNGILEFDGTNWRLIELPNKFVVRSLAMDDKTGTIYVGGRADLGNLKRDSLGALKYNSLLNIIPEEYRTFEDVWQTVVLKGQVVFRTSYSVFLLKNNKINTLLPDKKFHTGFRINNKFYVREVGKGLFVLEDDSFRFIEQSKIFANDRIYVMLPYKEDEIFMISRNQGVYIYTPNSKTEQQFLKPPNFKKIDDFIIKNQIYCGVELNKDQFALGTLQDALLIIDKNGNVIKHINRNSGLQDPTIFSLYVDSQKKLWVGLNKGTSYVILNSPFTFYDENDGLNGTVLTAKIYDKQLYVGTSLGLFRKNQQNGFTMLENIRGHSWFLIEAQGDLLLGSYEGIFRIKGNNTSSILSETENVWTLSKFKNPNYILGSASNGLQLLKYQNKRWKLKHHIKSFKEKTRYIQINGDTIWFCHQDKGVFRLRLNKGLDSVAELNFFNSNNGLPANSNNFVYKIKTESHNSQILFGTEKGIYGYNSKTKTFIPNDKFNQLLNAPGYIDKFMQDEKGDIYYQQGYEKGILQYQNDGTYKVLKTPFLKFKDLFIENILKIDSIRALFCSTKGIIFYNHQVKPNYNASYAAIIRQISANDSLLHLGTESPVANVSLPYKYNKLQFSYSALYFEDHDKTQYSYYLEGASNKWSEWSKKTEKEYNNLSEGKYIFKVKAKNVYEKESTIAEFEFEILPPWYRTYWAYLGYFVAIVLFISSLIRLNSLRLIKEKKKLEEIIHERTAEIVQQKEEIQTQAEKLITINENLLELNEFKQGLTSMIVHDLKNPLNLIINTPESIDYEKQNSIMRQSGKQMLNMVLNILDVDKFEDVKMVLDLEEKQFVLIANYAIKQIQFLSEQKNISIKNQIDQNLVTKVEEQITERILVNLLTNAIKYTPLNGSITLSSRPKSETFVQIEVTDTGEGIPKEKLNLVFQKFGQIVAKKSGGVRSTGLGLTFCKLAIEAHGGEIGVISEIGKGTTFWFTLQLSQKKHVTLKSIEKEEEIEQEIIIFTEAERTILEPIINRLNEFSVYETGDIEEIVAELKQNESKNILKWITQIKKNIITLNQTKYLELLKIE